jgi:hypothetical protein
MRSARSGPSGLLFQISLVAVLIGFGAYFDHASSDSDGVIAIQETELLREKASPQVRYIAQWAVSSRDHGGLPFVVVDKARARLFAFDPDGHLSGSGPVLLGAARSDDNAVPATPAGRFVADNWLSSRAEGIVWVNGATQLNLHAVPSSNAPGRGIQRLASRRLEDKRISEGSLHVAAEFYRDHLGVLRTQPSVAYVLPETLPVDEVFGSYKIEQRSLFAQLTRGLIARSPS